MKTSIGLYIKGKHYLHTLKCPECQQERVIKHSKKNIANDFLCRVCANKGNQQEHLWRPVTLLYYGNGTIISAPSITKFCKDRKYLGKNAKYHFSEVLNGSKLHYKGWLLPENKHKIKGRKIIKQIVLAI